MHLWAAVSTLQHSDEVFLLFSFLFLFVYRVVVVVGGKPLSPVFLQHEAEMRSDAIKSATGFLLCQTSPFVWLFKQQEEEEEG